jgi:hypothetical protein
MNLVKKYPLNSKHYFLSGGLEWEMRIVGHYISDMGRECVIAISDEGIPQEEIEAGEAIVIDTLYITRPVV